MNFERNIAEKITLINARKYLKATGWIPRPSLREDIALFGRNESDHGFDEVYLPKVQNDQWYTDTILEAAQRLSEFERRSVNDVLLDMQNPDYDRFSFRIISKNAEFGSIDLKSVNELISNVSAICSTAIKDQTDPKSFHKVINNKFVQQLQRSARFGQTSRGSFAINIFIPIDSQPDQEKNGELPSTDSSCTTHVFRDAMTHFMESLGEANQSILTGMVEEYAQKHQEQTAISANMFDTLSKTNIWDDTQLDIEVQWSQSVPVPEHVPHHILITQSEFPVYRQWARAFMPKTPEVQNVEFCGVVSELLGEDESEGQTVGYVKINVLPREGKPFNAQVYLSDVASYRKATQSHLYRQYVRFFGNYIPGGSPIEITNVKSLQIDEPTEAQSV